MRAIMTSNKIQPWLAGVLALGLTVAIATDGHVPAYAVKTLLGVLLVIDLIVAEWLTRPRGV